MCVLCVDKAFGMDTHAVVHACGFGAVLLACRWHISHAGCMPLAHCRHTNGHLILESLSKMCITSILRTRTHAHSLHSSSHIHVACLPGTGGPACDPCPVGFFSPGGNDTNTQPACSPCPGTTATAVPGASSAANCSGVCGRVDSRSVQTPGVL